MKVIITLSAKGVINEAFLRAPRIQQIIVSRVFYVLIFCFLILILVRSLEHPYLLRPGNDETSANPAHDIVELRSRHPGSGFLYAL